MALDRADLHRTVFSAGAVWFAIAYFALASATLQLTRYGGGVAAVWFAGPLLFAKLSATPRRRRLPFLVASMPAGVAAAVAYGFGQGIGAPLGLLGVGEGWLAALVLKRICPRLGGFASVGEVVRFTAIGGGLAPAVAAVSAALLVHGVAQGPFLSTLTTWYAGHALGMMVLGPPMLLVFRGEATRWLRSSGRAEAVPAATLLLLVSATIALTFGQSRVPLVILPLMPMLAATFRLGRFGAIASILLLVAGGMAASLAGTGPTFLLPIGMASRLIVLQLYFASVVSVLLAVAAELLHRRRLLERLRTAEALHRLVLDRSGDGILRLDGNGRVRYASPSVLRLLGRPSADVIGHRFQHAIDPADADRATAAWDAARSQADVGSFAEYRCVTRDGARIWVETHMRATFAACGAPSGGVCIMREVTERRREVEALALEAVTDPLTGLANRRGFERALADAASAALAGGDACLAIFDIDHFKSVNDRHGHAAGDVVLGRFATVLRSTVRGGDAVFRLGGEEFGVLLTGAGVAKAAAICERIRTALEAGVSISPKGVAIRVTVSAGLAAVAAGMTPEEVLIAADLALYSAKRGGRNRLALAA